VVIWGSRGAGGRAGRTKLGGMARFVVNVMPKPEILDPQGQAILGALPRLDFGGVREVRQGKHFEIEVDDGTSDETVREIAATLLANPVIEDWTVSRVGE
jgi:phosphoribosylformylglycinamidine synthase subunit PurS